MVALQHNNPALIDGWLWKVPVVHVQTGIPGYLMASQSVLDPREMLQLFPGYRSFPSVELTPAFEEGSKPLLASRDISCGYQCFASEVPPDSFVHH